MVLRFHPHRRAASMCLTCVCSPLRPLVAVAPFYIDIMSSGSGESLRILRLARSFRLLKLSRYSTGFTVVKNALVASSDALQLFVMVLLLVLIVFSSAIYYMERGDWDESTQYYYRTPQVNYWPGNLPPEGKDPSPFQSIPHSFWWCMVTLTTVSEMPCLLGSRREVLLIGSPTDESVAVLCRSVTGMWCL